MKMLVKTFLSASMILLASSPFNLSAAENNEGYFEIIQAGHYCLKCNDIGCDRIECPKEVV